MSEGSPAPARRSARAGWRSLAILASPAPPRLGRAAAYASAPGAVVLVALLQYSALPEPSIAPFVFFYFGIALVSWLGGAGPGLLAVALSAAVANWLFIVPYRSIAVHRAALVATLLFLVSASAISLLCARFRDATLRAHQAAADLGRHAALLARSEDALRKSEARYRTLFDSMDEGFCVIEVLFDPAGSAIDYRFLEVNRAFERQSGIVNAAGRRMRELLPSHEQHWFETYGRVALTGEPVRFENAVAALGRWFDVYAFRIGDPERRTVAILFNDVSERRRVAEELREADRRKLVDDLLDVTRVERGKIRLHREKLELQALLRRAAEDHRGLLEKNGIALEVVVAPEPLFVNGDAARLGQVIGNLLQNAAKFTPPGGTATLGVARVDERLAEISVRDTGEGIAPDVMPRLFEPFVQAEQTLHRSSGGLGLGLALVKGLVELHGGTVRAESPGPGGGASFTVRLPVERRAASRLDLGPEPEAGWPVRHVLIIEDNVDAADTMKELLELAGHRVEVAYSGTDGLASARASLPDVALCDIGLPGLDGLEVARAVRADPALWAVGLVALSGYAQPQDLEASQAAGFDVHLAKPTAFETLERAIGEACEAASVRTAKGGPAPLRPA